MAQTVKNPPAMRETRVQSLCWEDLLEKEMATHSRIPAWRIPWTEEPWGGTEEPWGGPAGEGGHSPRGRKESDATEH